MSPWHFLRDTVVGSEGYLPVVQFSVLIALWKAAKLESICSRKQAHSLWEASENIPRGGKGCRCFISTQQWAGLQVICSGNELTALLRSSTWAR